MSAARGIRAENRERLEAEILRLGRAQLAEVGAAALSVRAIARELGMASSAVYRYVASRDDLLTRLIVESYTSLGDAVEAAEGRLDRGDLHGRWRAIGFAVRDWAFEHPHDWALLYGSPVPGYAAPGEITTGPGTRVQMLLVGLLADVVARRKVAADSRRPELGGVAEAARTVATEMGLGAPASLDLVAAGVTAWTILIGAVNSDVFEYLGPDMGRVGWFEYALDVAGRLIIR